MRFPDSRFIASLGAVLLLLAAPAAQAATKPAKARLVATAPEPVNTPDSLIAGARAAAARGETDLALRLAQSAIVADPIRTAAYTALGDIYAGNSEPDYARNFYNQALAIDPSDAAALSAIAALDRNGDKQAANTGSKPGTP